MRRFLSLSSFSSLLVAAAVLAPSSLTAHAQSVTEAVVYNFCAISNASANCQDGADPFDEGMVQGYDGNYYGTTADGGSTGNGSDITGTAFRLAPDGTLTVLHSFCTDSTDVDDNYYCLDGSFPYNSLVQGPDGTLYGETLEGGNPACAAVPWGGSCGTIFKIAPDGTFSTLHSFTGTDGWLPIGGLVLGSDGNLYGTTGWGGSTVVNSLGSGTFFKITPAGTLTTLHEFCTGRDDNGYCVGGGQPQTTLVQGSDGNFYGGAGGGDTTAGAGEIYSISPSGTFTLIYSFCPVSGCVDGAFPYAALVEGADGQYYGVTQSFGAYNYAGGTVFKVSTAGVLTTLHSFCQTLNSYNSCTDGGYPTAALTIGGDGNFYGTTAQGGTGAVTVGGGTFFEITPSGSFQSLYSFCSDINRFGYCTDGSYPGSAIIQGSDGNFYSNTQNGGANNDAGTVFSMMPSKKQGAPVFLSLSASSVAAGTAVTLNWRMLNAYSLSQQQCYAFVQGGVAGAGTWTGKLAGTLSNGTYSGTGTITPTAAGTYTYAVTCAGTVSGFATLTVTNGGGKSNTTTTLTASPSPATVGQTVTLTATVAKTSGSGTPTGTVTFLVDGVQEGQPVTLNSSGVATLTLTAGAPSTNSLTANYGGDAGDNGSTGTASIVINKAPTTTTLVAAPSPATAGQTVTLTATVARTAGSGTPTGSVTFKVNGNQQGQPAALNSSGVATLTFTQGNSGTDSLTANYSGDGSDTLSTGMASLVVNNAATKTTLTAAPSPATVGQTVTLTATVARTAGSGTPTGKVTFEVNGTPQEQPVALNSSGVATMTFNPAATGTDSLTANYGGDPGDSISTGTASLVVNKAATATTLTAAPSPATIGQTVTLTATVARTVGSGTPTGTVTFEVNGKVQGSAVTVNSSGVATTTFKAAAVGTDALTAIYNGDASDNSSTGTASLVVNKVATTTTLTAAPSNAIVGSTVTLTATVAKASGSGAPTGAVTFEVNGTEQGSAVTLNASGVATLTFSAAAAGTDSLTATYSGDGSDSSSTAMDTLVVGKAATATTLVGAPSGGAVVGNDVRLTATVTRTTGSGIPGGTITFLANGAAQGNPFPLDSGGSVTAVVPTGTVAAGSYTLEARYNPDGNDNGSTSAGLKYTLTKATTATVLSVPGSTGTVGESGTLTATVTRTDGSGVPTGSVVFYANGNRSLGTGTLNSAGKATLTIDSAPYGPGSYSLSATYQGDGGDSQSSSAAVPFTLKQAATVTTVTATPATAVQGQTVTVTAAVARTAGSGTPGGKVTFTVKSSAGSVTVTANLTGGSATFSHTTAGEPLGTYQITATYSGDTDDAGSSGNATVNVVSAAWTEKVMHSFCSETQCADGSSPLGTLIEASDGNLYGTTSSGAATIFNMTLPGSLTTLYTFGVDGGTTGPSEAGLMEYSSGEFFGTTYGEPTYNGCSPNCGTLFDMPPAGGTVNVFYSFCGSTQGCGDSGGLLTSPLIAGTGSDSSTLYGTTTFGTIFAKAAGAGPLVTLYTFCSQAPCTSGRDPVAGLVQGNDGNLYGTAKADGANAGSAGEGGTVFQYNLASSTLTVLHSFCAESDCADGQSPESSLVEGSDGNFYGTTQFGGASGDGTVFRITPSGTLTTLHSFAGTNDGAQPVAELVLAGDGNFYGTTKLGGANGDGTVFQMTPVGALTTLYSFCGESDCTDGGNPQTGLVEGSDGNLYGTTYKGGANKDGTVFQLLAPLALPAAVQVTASASTVNVGSEFTLSWKVLNAFSETMQVCNALVVSGASGAGTWSGAQAGMLKSGVYSGSAVITPTAAGTYIYALTCGGRESGFATVKVN